MIKEIKEAEPIRKQLYILTGWAKAILEAPDFIECRDDEDCDHCLGLEIVKDSIKALEEK